MRAGLLIAAAAAGIGLYFWTSGDWRRLTGRVPVSEPLPIPPIPPEIGGPGALSLGPQGAQSQGAFAWLTGRPENPERFFPSV